MSCRTLSVSTVLVCACLLWVAACAALGATGYEVYSVQPGDTLTGIAQKFGVDASAIATFNDLASGASLLPGQSLNIPTGADASNAKAQQEFAAEEKQAQDVATAELTIKPAAQVRNGPVVGYLGMALDSVAAFADPRRKDRVCTIARGSNLCVSCQYGDYYGVLMSDGAVAWVPKKSVDVQRVELVAGIEVPRGASTSAAVIEAAFRYYGAPYHYGGIAPGPTDCSGLVLAAYRDCGYRLPRTAAAQFGVGFPVPLDQLAVGDRLYFFNNEGYIGHTGIYIGNGLFIHASSRRGYVAVDSLRSGFYLRHLAGARRP
jgi:cell wall-associated NlpC family hydrolase